MINMDTFYIDTCYFCLIQRKYYYLCGDSLKAFQQADICPLIQRDFF